MSSEEKKLIDFVLHLPPDTNPYDAVARQMKGLMTPPRLPTWATIAQRCAIAMFIILFVQAVHLIYARVKVGAYKVWSFTRRGSFKSPSLSFGASCGKLIASLHPPQLASIMWMLRVPAARHMRYSVPARFPCRETDTVQLNTVAIADLLLLDLANAGMRDLSGEITLFGCKYVLIVGNAWFFLWVCACQCATLICESGAGEGSVAGRRIHPIIRIAMNTSLLTAIVLPVPFVIYFYTRINLEYNLSKSILGDVLLRLRTKAATATPQNFNRMELLATIAPARKLQPLASHVSFSPQHKMATYTRSGIMVYLLELTILSVVSASKLRRPVCSQMLTPAKSCQVYVPLLAFSLGRLYARSVSQKKLTQAASGGEAAENISKMGRKIREQRRRLVTHALMTYVTTCLHVPIIIAQLSYEGDGFLNDKRWLTLTRVGLSVPFSIGGNVIAFILNIHARNQLIESRSRNASAVSSSCSGSNHKETFMPKFNPAFGEKDLELSILPRFPGLDNDSYFETIDARKATFGHFSISSDPPVSPLKTSPTSNSHSVMKKSSVHFNPSN
ncbi:hypothetical protein DFH28DRAFT_1184266 [Melampsora americana]|nr:hypothetical protein DFH28DRAFT_1184266 [Melampsora americana]